MSKPTLVICLVEVLTIPFFQLVTEKKYTFFVQILKILFMIGTGFKSDAMK